MHSSITAHLYVWNISALNHWIGNNAGFQYRPRFLLTSEQWQAANYPNVHWSLQGSPRMQWPLKVKCFFFLQYTASGMRRRSERNIYSTQTFQFCGFPQYGQRPNCYISKSFQWGYEIPQRFQEPEVLRPGYKSASRWKTQAIIKFSQYIPYESQGYSFTRHHYIIHD